VLSKNLCQRPCFFSFFLRAAFLDLDMFFSDA